LHHKAGTLVNCQTTGNSLDSPQSVTADASGQFAYITNQVANSVSLCTISTSNGLFENCTPTGNGFNAPSDFSFSSSHKLAYISNANSVSVCQVNQQNGTLSNCNNYNGNFNHSTGIRVNANI
jgi:6-phosphogluconolactonase (cycloisomerase 2 family)